MDITLTQPLVMTSQRIRLRFNEVSEDIRNALVAELYRTENITFRQAQELLEQSWERTAAILEEHGCTLYYDEDDFMNDRKTLESVLFSKKPA